MHSVYIFRYCSWCNLWHIFNYTFEIVRMLFLNMVYSIFYRLVVLVYNQESLHLYWLYNSQVIELVLHTSLCLLTFIYLFTDRFCEKIQYFEEISDKVKQPFLIYIFSNSSLIHSFSNITTITYISCSNIISTNPSFLINKVHFQAYHDYCLDILLSYLHLLF